jgi:hypothetical protein
MLGLITVRQFEEWRAYADIEPFDEERADLRAAQIVRELRDMPGRRRQPRSKLRDCALVIQQAPATIDPKAARRGIVQSLRLLGEMGKAARAKAARKKERKGQSSSAPIMGLEKKARTVKAPPGRHPARGKL